MRVQQLLLGHDRFAGGPFERTTLRTGRVHRGPLHSEAIFLQGIPRSLLMRRASKMINLQRCMYAACAIVCGGNAAGFRCDPTFSVGLIAFIPLQFARPAVTAKIVPIAVSNIGALQLALCPTHSVDCCI